MSTPHGRLDSLNAEQHETSRLPHHYESDAVVKAGADRVFDYVDDYLHLSSHMSKSSWMMGGGRMDIELDQGGGKKRGSRIRLSGRAFGVRLSVAEIVTTRDPPYRKIWETTDPPRLLVIGHYRMGFEITPQQQHSLLRVFIDYALPETPVAHWFGRLFAPYYARWCTRRMAADAARHFSGSKVES